MCFRPASVSLPEPDCPECGKKISAVNGVFPTVCPHCGADLSKYEEEFKAQMAAAPGFAPPPGAPGAPKPPGAPGAPSAPRAPGAPKPPGA